MSPSPSTVRTIAKRSLGSNTKFWESIQLPFVMYHGGRGFLWLVRHWRGTVTVLGLWVAWGLTGSLWAGLLVVGLVWGLVLGVVWNRRIRGADSSFSAKDLIEEQARKRTLEKQWPLACEAAGLMAPRTLNYPALRKVRAPEPGTLEADVAAGRIGVLVPDMQKRVVALSEVIGCREVVVTPTGPGEATLAFHWRDPVGRHLALADLPPAHKKGHLAYGIRNDGSVATILSDKSLLIGGLTGMGKSTVVWALLADCIRQRIPVHLYVSDPKGGVELDAFEAAMGDAATGLVKVRRYAKTAAETVKMLDVVEEAMHKRQQWMKANNVREIVPDETNPLVITILDETLPLTELLKKGTDSALGRIGYTGRAAGYVIWANTQVAQVDAVGRFRDLIPQRICFATPNSQVTDAVLGGQAEAAGALCSKIRQPGVGYSYTEGQHTPLKFRSADITDEEVQCIAHGRLPGAIAEIAEMQRIEASGEGVLYRHFTEDGELLYVGKTNDYARRTDEHAKTKDWWKEVASTTVEHFTTEAAALAAEKAAIIREKPRINYQHNLGNPNRRPRRVTNGTTKRKVAAHYSEWAAKDRAKAKARA